MTPSADEMIDKIGSCPILDQTIVLLPVGDVRPAPANVKLNAPIPPMAAVATAQVRDFAELIREEYRLYIQAGQTTAMRAVTLGNLLIEAQNRLPHGHFIPWIEANFDFTRKAAATYMRAAKKVCELEKCNQSVTFASIARLLAPPEPHVSHNSGENEWYTPLEYIEAARRVLGNIDLDPASSTIANKTVKAAKIFTKEDSGLEKKWEGKVYLNPPYEAKLIRQFAAKFANHVQNGDIQTGIVLTNNATETEWFNEFVTCSKAIVFPTSRIKFLGPHGNLGAPLQGQAFFYFGDDPKKFLSEFEKFGWGALPLR